MPKIAITRRDTLVFFGAVVLCFAIFFSTQHMREEDSEISTRDTQEQRQLNENFPLVNPLLSCGQDTGGITNRAINEIKNSVELLIADAQDRGVVKEVGVYFRELNDGSWFGIGEDLKFTPGSLLKVPLAMSVMKKRSVDASFLSSPLRYDEEVARLAPVYPPKETAVQGQSYSLDELLRLSLIHSDNTATLLLSRELDQASLEASYLDLSIEQPHNQTYSMSVRIYASFFRILYNGTYISPKDSNYLLAMLSESAFREGIVAGVPAETTVAHKFGERTNILDETHQLHDCGIVYHASQPYVLCVMLRGPAITQLPPVIASISQAVYRGIAREDVQSNDGE